MPLPVETCQSQSQSFSEHRVDRGMWLGTYGRLDPWLLPAHEPQPATGGQREKRREDGGAERGARDMTRDQPRDHPSQGSASNLPKNPIYVRPDKSTLTSAHHTTSPCRTPTKVCRLGRGAGLPSEPCTHSARSAAVRANSLLILARRELPWHRLYPSDLLGDSWSSILLLASSWTYQDDCSPGPLTLHRCSGEQ